MVLSYSRIDEQAMEAIIRMMRLPFMMRLASLSTTGFGFVYPSAPPRILRRGAKVEGVQDLQKLVRIEHANP